jgi:large-conductance mechanosensitive channel
MTPTSPFAGLLTGLVDGLIIAVAVFLVVQLNNRRRRPVPIEVRRDATDYLTTTIPPTPEGELPRVA